ncbi:TPA: phage tail spike protein [Streptococcus suis]
MLYLLDKDVKTVKWNGIPLHEASSAIVKEEINGDFYMTVRYPITDSGIYQLIKEDMLIKAPVPVLGAQLFRIKKPVENDDSLDITAYHISDDVMQRSINPVSVVGQGCAMALSQMVQNAKTDLGTFSFTSDIMDSRTFNTTDAETLYSVLLDGKHSIVGTWEGELVRDNFAVSIKRSRGADRGVVITTHKNLKSYQRTKNSQSVVTRIHAKSTFKPEGADEETTITVTVDSPLISNYPYINEKDYENNNAKTVDELRKWAEAKFKNEGIDKISDAIEIEAYELDGQVIHLGDTVNIKSRKHDVDLHKKAIAYEYNALTEKYISITFDDKPGVGGSGVSSGLSNAADVILGVNANAQEVAIERAVRNANQAFDAEFEKRVEEINDGIEQAKAEAERHADNIKRSIDTEIAQVNQSMQAQSEEHDRQVADILSKTQSVESLANQAKSDAASALARANQVKTEAIADARAQIATVSQALNTAKSELQSAIASADQKARDSQASAAALRNDLNVQASKILEQARAQTALTNRVSTVETLADGTRSTVAELSKTVNKATGDIASVSSRTKTVEDTLSQTRTQYEALTQTVNAQTGQIESINRKTADLQSGLDGVNNRFETIWVSEKNLLSDTETLSTYAPLAYPANNYLGRAIKRISKSANTSAYAEGLIMQTNETLVNPKEMILSFYVKANRDARIRCFMYNPNANKDVATSDGYTAKSSADGMAVLNVTTSWQRVWVKWTYLVNYFAKPRVIIGRIIETYDTDVSVDISAPALYHGHHNKEWSPADLDFKNELATYVQNAQESSAELVRRIETADGKAVDAKAYAQQTANGFNTRIESLESYKNEEGTRASQYLTASRTETAKQITAERTAISANYVAKSVYDEDARGTTQKLNEIKTTADAAKQNLATYQNTVDRKLEELTSSTQTLDGKINTASAKVDTVAGQIRTEISTVEGKIPTTIGATNYIRDFGFANNPNFNSHTSLWKYERIADSTARSGYHIKATCTQSGSNGFHRYFYDLRWARYQGRVMTYSVDIKASKSVRMRLGAEAFNKGYKAFDVTTEWQRFVSTDTVNFKTYYSFPFYADTITWAVGDIIYIRDPQLEDGTIATTPRAAEEDLRTDISSIKTTITQTASGVEQLSTSLSTTNNKVSTAETKINQLIGDVSSKVSQTDYNTLTGRVSSAETAITQNATEISKRLTSTQVESAITGKGYQTKTQVDNNITGRGYITNSALQPYALSTTVQNLVKETADSFSRTISETRGLIPSNVGTRNLLKGTKDLSGNDAKNFNTSDKYLDFNIARSRPTTGYSDTFSAYTTIPVTANDYIISFYAKSDVDGATLYCHFYNPSTTTKAESSTGYKGGSSDGLARVQVTTEWQRYWVKWSQSKTDTVKKVIIGRNNSADGIKIIEVAGVALYEGALNKGHFDAPEDLVTVTALHNVTDKVDSHTRTIGAVGETGSILDNVSKVTQTAAGLVQEVSGDNGLKTQVSTLAGSYAIKNLTSAGTVLNQLNLNKDGSIKLDGSLVQITGKTYIQDGVITSAKIAGLDAGKITTGTLDAARIKANSIDGSKLVFDQAFFNNFMANEAYLKQIFAKNAFITSVQAVAISASNVTTGILRATNGAMDVNLDNASMIFRQDAKIEFQSENNTLFRTRNGTSAFIHFRDDSYNGVYTAMGVNADNTGTQNDYSSGLFAGVRVIRTNPNRYSGTAVDQVQIVADEVRFRDAYGYNRDYLTIIWDQGSKIDLVQWMRQFNTNFKHLVNITGRGDVIKTF